MSLLGSAVEAHGDSSGSFLDDPGEERKALECGWARPLTPFLAKAREPVFTVYGGVAAFLCYFAMYAFLKPFKAGSFAEHALFAGTQVKFKTALVVSQLLGYMTSKFVGVKYVAEAKNSNVPLHLVCLITFAQATLILYGLLPWDWKVIAMFLNGLPLGVVWGLVVSFLEGRRTSDYMLCSLCCAFIVSSGAVKDCALWALQMGVGETWMPAVVSAVFYPVFVLCVWLLYQMPKPTAEDVASQSERRAMDGKDRMKYIKSQRVGLTMLWLGVTVLTAFRDFRDTFQKELFEALLGRSPEPGVFSKSEVIVGVFIAGVVGMLGLIRNNKMSSQVSVGYLILGSVVMLCSAAWFSADPELNASLYMILTGIGSYLSYVPYNSVLFERLIAYTLAEATVSFPMAVSQALGYLGTCAVYLVYSFGHEDMPYLDFFQLFSYTTALFGLAIYAMVYVYYFVVFPRWHHTSETGAAKEVCAGIALERACPVRRDLLSAA